MQNSFDVPTDRRKAFCHAYKLLLGYNQNKLVCFTVISLTQTNTMSNIIKHFNQNRNLNRQVLS